MAFTVIDPTQVDAKSPIDDTLMGEIKTDLDDLNTRVVVAGAKPFFLELQGRLQYMSLWKRSICGMILNDAFQPTECRFGLKRSGLSGTLGFDIRKHTTPRVPITGIDHQYSGATTSIAQQGTALNTQSIARNATQIATQSISHAKAAANIQSIILLGLVDNLGANMVQYNLDVAVDADTLNGDSVVFASATTGANNGTFVIVEKNRGGGNNVVVANASGAAQTGAAGTMQIKIMSYNFTNPVDAVNFAGGYSHIFASHTTGANNGTLLVYAVNQAGNNIWVKNATGATQAGVAGTVDTSFWKFTLTGAASVTDYVVGEAAKTASHTTPANNVGALTIILVNSGGNNLVLYNSAGVAQGGVAGTINTNRWKYAMPSDPTSNVSVGQTINATLHTNALNNGVFTVKDISSTTIVVYNTSGIAQASTPGLVASTRKLVKFAADQSAAFSTLSFIEMQGCVDSTYNYSYQIAPFAVLQINRGGGANFNVVIDAPLSPSQASPAGYVQTEMKSIFSVAPSLAVDLTSLEPNQNISSSSSSMVTSTIAASTPVMLYLTSIPTGDPRDLTVLIL